MFDLTRPCANCPFRLGQGSRFQLGQERIEEIVEAVAFQCHKTVDYDRYDDPETRSGDRPQQCAGLMAILHREDRPNQIMQVAGRISDFDSALVDPRGEAYASIADAMRAHVEGLEPDA